MAHAKQYVVCIDNKGYAASLEKRKIYVALRDTGAEKHGLLRIVDESGEDYLYPKASFRSIALPHAVKKGGSGRLAATAPGKVAAPAILAESGIDVLLPSPSDYQTSR